jgi:hypothetical protein
MGKDSIPDSDSVEQGAKESDICTKEHVEGQRSGVSQEEANGNDDNTNALDKKERLVRKAELDSKGTYANDIFYSFDPKKVHASAPHYFLAVPPPPQYGGFNQLTYFREGRTVPAPLVCFPSGPPYGPPVLVGNPPVWTIPRVLQPSSKPRLLVPSPPPQAIAEKKNAIELDKDGGGSVGSHKTDRHGNVFFDPGPPIQTSPDGHGPDDSNLFVFHIPNGISNLDLFNRFSSFGTVISARIMVDTSTGRSRGFGFVSFDNSASAALAIEKMNGFEIGDKRLKVQLKKDKAPGPYLPAGYGPDNNFKSNNGRGRRKRVESMSSESTGYKSENDEKSDVPVEQSRGDIDIDR